jgi:hypothetical protein
MAQFEFGTPERRRIVAVKKTPREKYIDSLNEQKLVFDGLAAGQKEVRRKNNKKIRPRWFEANPGEYWIGLYYGNRPFTFSKSPALKVGDYDHIPAGIDFLIQQAKNGSFDKELNRLAGEMSKMRLGTKRK